MLRVLDVPSALRAAAYTEVHVLESTLRDSTTGEAGRYPATLSNCLKCHEESSYQLPLDDFVLERTHLTESAAGVLQDRDDIGAKVGAR